MGHRPILRLPRETRTGPTGSGLAMVEQSSLRQYEDMMRSSMGEYVKINAEVAMNLQEILADIHALEEELLTFERKYGVRSETFYAAYISGEEPEEDAWVLDFGEWASVYQTWLRRQADYRDTLQRLQKKPSSLAGLIRVTP